MLKWNDSSIKVVLHVHLFPYLIIREKSHACVATLQEFELPEVFLGIVDGRFTSHVTFLLVRDTHLFGIVLSFYSQSTAPQCEGILAGNDIRNEGANFMLDVEMKTRSKVLCDTITKGCRYGWRARALSRLSSNLFARFTERRFRNTFQK